MTLRAFRIVMSIHESLNESLGAIRMVFGLETQIEAGAELLRSALLGEHKLLTCGNGGSAADRSHLASEFACRFVSDRRPYSAIGLAADGALQRPRPTTTLSKRYLPGRFARLGNRAIYLSQSQPAASHATWSAPSSKRKAPASSRSPC